MRRALIGPAAGVLLAGPTVLAFWSGGFFAEPRLWAALGAWVLVLVAAVAAPHPLPRSRAGWAAIAGLAILTAWTGLSILWAPLSGPALEATQRLLLYLGAFVAAIALLRPRAVAAAAEPVLALGALVVIGYGLAGRVLPGIVHLHHSLKAGARLEQPLSYWNAEGALAAMGLVLCARVAGDPRRRPWLRAVAAAACVPLGAGVYLSFSRGAIAAAVVGVIVLVAAAPSREQARAAAGALLAAVAAALVTAVLPGVASLSGTGSARERDGLVALGLLVAIMAAAGAVSARAASRRPPGPPTRLAAARLLPAVAAAAVALALGGVVVGGLLERGNGSAQADRQDASRLTTVRSNRHEYWRVGLRAFADQPLQGLGAGGFRVAWLRDRRIGEGVRDVHSLELEQAAELGLVGLAALLTLLGGLGVAGREALRRGGPPAAGAVAAGTVWLVHATIDWDWQMPAVTLPALILAGALVARAEAPADPPLSGRARRSGRAVAAPGAPAAHAPDRSPATR